MISLLTNLFPLPKVSMPAVARVQNPVKASLMMMGAGLMVTLMVVFARLAAANHAIIEITFWRNLVGAIAVACLLALQGRRGGPGFAILKTNRPGAHIVRGLIGLTGLSLNFWAVTLLPLAQQTALFFAMPLMVTVLAIPLLKERVDWRRWSGVLLGFCGILVMTSPTGGGAVNLFGVAVALGGAFFTALVAIALRNLGSTEPETRTVFFFCTLAAILSACFLPWFWTTPTPYTFLCLLACGLSGTTAQILTTRAYAMAPAAFLSPFNYLSILYSTLFGWLLWGEWPDHAVFVGAVIVIASGVLTLWLERTRTRKAETEAESSYG